MTSRNETPTDGRRARRERGRVAVTEAMIDLVLEGHVPPTADQIAARAGVSVASLFRYFETLDELRRVTTHQYFERFAHAFEIEQIGDGSLDERVDRFAASRISLYETVEPMARLARWKAREVNEVDETLRLVRATFVDQIRLHFAPELLAFSSAGVEDTVMVIATLTSFESWEQARHDHDRTAKQVRRAWAAAVRKVMTL